MKKFLLIILALTMCFLLCSCGKTLDGKILTYTGPGNFQCTATFNDGQMHFRSPVTDDTFSYELVGDDTIILEGEITYTYKIDGSTVEFDSDFMGVSDYWHIN